MGFALGDVRRSYFSLRSQHFWKSSGGVGVSYSGLVHTLGALTVSRNLDRGRLNTDLNFDLGQAGGLFSKQSGLDNRRILQVLADQRRPLPGLGHCLPLYRLRRSL